ncbi:vWFA domain containing protein [uncultured Caudovirales phage]|uniref:VWFA domain containing protein n=1 Tax=uncultured Caudovirales phage TaxID=2100421 RepID=A0A6J5L495_9CAUD|nr:vWFA domain containing protein [uncultured Caudovirales phage]
MNDIDKNLAGLAEALSNAIDELEPPQPEPSRVVKLNDGALNAEQSRRLRMLQVVGKFASTLTLRPIKVSLSTEQDPNHQPAPAWSDSDNIWFNDKDMGDLSDVNTVLGIKGLSLHEVAHILLTPRTGSNLAKDVQRESLWRAFNALEDQRIEMMMTKRFGNVADWLTATVLQFIMEEPEQWALCYPLLHGRKYLPKELRTQVAKLYENQQDVARLGQLIDQYIVLNLADPKNYPVAIDIIREYSRLVEGLPQAEGDDSWQPETGWGRIHDPAGHHERKEGEWKSSKSKPMTKAEQEKLSDKVQQSVDGDNASGDDESDSAGNTPSNNDSSDGNDKPGQGLGVNTTGPNLNDIASSALDKIKQSKSREIAQIMKQYGGDIELTSGKGANLPKSDGRLEPVTIEATKAAKSFANELEKLRAEFDPGWLRRTESGRLNVQRYVTGTDIDECFDEWDLGREDAVDIEAVILLDTSGSMYENAKGAFESMWAIKRALDKITASTTVVTFDSTSVILYSADERANHKMKWDYTGGSTNPMKGLQYANNVLAQSKRAIKICIVITDGVWDQSEACDKMLREFRRAGVLTALGYIPDSYYVHNGYPIQMDSHGCEIAVNISDMAQLFTLARHLVRVGIARNLANA